MNPNISICIPNYNSEKYIAYTLESVFGQSYHDFRLYIIDNCSTDKSLEIISRFKDSRIQILENKRHLSITENFNNCVSQCETEYLCIMHADDIYASDYLEVMHRALAKYPKAGIAHCDFSVIDEQNRVINHFRSNLKRQKLPLNSCSYFMRTPIEELPLLLKVPYIICPAVMYRKSIFEKVGMFNANYRQVEDWDFFVRVLLNDIPILFVNEKLFYNRIHDSATNQHRSSLIKYREQLSFFRHTYDLLCQKGLNIDWNLHQAYQMVFQVILWDIKEDLLKNECAEAKKKLEFLVNEVPIYNNPILRYFVALMIKLGPGGGGLLDKLAKLYLTFKKDSGKKIWQENLLMYSFVSSSLLGCGFSLTLINN